MATLVFLHAHPDDEASGTSGTMVLAKEHGHRVVWVCATNGDHGTAPEGCTTPDEVAAARRLEAEASARVLGVDRLVWLGYADSGMTGWEQNHNDLSFARANPVEAGRKVADVLDEEGAEVLVGYDWHGGYGHPDHIMVHTVMNQAAEQAARRPRVLQATFNRDRQRQRAQEARAAGMDLDWDPDGPADDGNPMGTLEADLHWDVDITDVIASKRAALQCHASQSDVQSMLSMPDEVFELAFGHEYFIEEGLAQPMTAAWPFGSSAGSVPDDSPATVRVGDDRA
ncbi:MULTISPECIES: PIG-L deacetylase family protein [Aestuariimicrobium]|uniref:PIG-L deacetylase family protein n=1 Tax=Aestuariimicrobium TaxID=396388 RepID=UPI0003B56CCB|nr:MULTISPECIES: PIG-L family deacetylase [Aestuariimicrobium]CAI9404054.1 Mycothiol S-conjugate amidase [Aestuariimicrobium sp. T2.26MG-19.2B]